MANIVEVVERDGDTINIYESGAEYNVTQKKLVRPASHTLITDENATAYNRRRQELARQELIAGANEAVEELRPEIAAQAMQGDLAYVRAIGYATTAKALNPKDPKQTEAARLLLNIGERLGQQDQDTPPAQPPPTRMVLLLAQLHERQSEVVEGQVLRSDILITDNDARSSVDDDSPADKDGSE
jgi:hypothetical protein